VVREFIEWLRKYNDEYQKGEQKQKVGFYGMDLYSFYSSMETVISYLSKVSPEDAKAALEAYSNFDRFQGMLLRFNFTMKLKDDFKVNHQHMDMLHILV
jgi:erythromycin esterase-like protein